MYVIVNGNGDIIVTAAGFHWFSSHIANEMKRNAYTKLLEFETEQAANDYIKNKQFNQFVRSVPRNSVAALNELEPKRETSWVVEVNENVSVYNDNGNIGTAITNGAWSPYILRFKNRSDAETLARLLGVGEPALVYTDDMTLVEAE